ncbi:hypothetical protein BCR41DRAFT_423377 [Lobosporangium transversale]|uniref:Uncharacterized protein n=1 Tax=Lobosporangium transversale TaxID=64571 RepID=A0A1Y2GI90_9FUNG|nr:hypothetical protein BCR41DRAFT_423722 [Lobosporangium transversale]XP_021879736.1 hypothetical protein BCR41DRAFT_423377 [Lobosporangium transversale]ORZ11052.1 hypothetical protein BCR41DRAFT_423722 [Lobosporangium transversale]ORZ11639.1 hypothetical protein BCR41DRAFT_423377 [Lobosporangium transversale]|eukprot:XP_021879569.1 hypothetical protein BCR41DRAFT_423722 [Lobosporangium transversale]
MTPGAKQELAAKIKVLDYIEGKRSENPEAVLMSLTASDRSSVEQSLLESILDDNAPIPGIQEVVQAVQKASDLCEARLPVLPGLKLSNKRQRQR